MYKPSLGTFSILNSGGWEPIGWWSQHTAIYSILKCLVLESFKFLAGYIAASFKPSENNEREKVLVGKNTNFYKILASHDVLISISNFGVHEKKMYLSFMALGIK